MERFYADHYFHAGFVHVTGGKPCQDFSLSGVWEGAAYAMVADGCSTGGHTDVGARLISFATASAIKAEWSTSHSMDGELAPREIAVRQRLTLGGIRHVLGLEARDMLATCLYACLAPGGGFIHLQGDGVVACGLAGGGVVILSFEWTGNMPFYPAYAEDHCASFIQAHGGDLCAPVLTEERWRYSPGGFERTEVIAHTLSAGIKGITLSVNDLVEGGELSFLALFSDGVRQIDKKDWKEAVLELLTFKSVTGEFAKRRMIRFIRETEKMGRGPIDDLSFAVVRVSWEEEVGKDDADERERTSGT